MKFENLNLLPIRSQNTFQPQNRTQVPSKQKSLKLLYTKKFEAFFSDVPGEIRTPDRRLRRPLLYPAELLGHDVVLFRFNYQRQDLLYADRDIKSTTF